MTEPIIETMKETVNTAKKVGEEGFQDTDLEEDMLMEMSAFKPEPEDEDHRRGSAGNQMDVRESG